VRTYAECGEVAACPGAVMLFAAATGTGDVVGQALSESKIPFMISMTGSIATGQKTMQAAAANITKVNLELGGKAPAIVMADYTTWTRLSKPCGPRALVQPLTLLGAILDDRGGNENTRAIGLRRGSLHRTSKNASRCTIANTTKLFCIASVATKE